MVTIEQLRGEGYAGGDSVVQGMYKINAEHLDGVLEGVKRGSVIPMVGAGFSAGAYPLWRNLLLDWAKGFGSVFENEVEGLLNEGKFEEAASRVEEEMGENTFRDAIKNEFGEPTLRDAYNKLTRERRGFPQIFRGCVLTTNYDRLLERAYDEAGLGIESVCPHGEYHRAQAEGGLQRGDRMLFKLHGDAWDPTNAVITRDDYNRFYGSKGGTGKEKTLVDHMRNAFTGKQALFLGCSLSKDRTLDVLKGCCKNMTQYALVELPKETRNDKDPFSPILVDSKGLQIPAYKDKRLWLDSLGIRPIWYPYGEHSALDALLGWLEAEVVRPFDRAPSKLPRIPRSTYGVIGRDDEVKKVVDSLESDGVITLVSGAGGIGKTEVCREALRRLGEVGRDIVYVETAGAMSAWEQCGAVADALNVSRLGQSDEVAISDYANRLARAMVGLSRPVVYLDNWEDAWEGASNDSGKQETIELLDVLREEGASILVSSRARARGINIQIQRFKIGALKPKSASELFDAVLRNEVGDEEGLDLKDSRRGKLLNMLEGYPLAIVLVGTYAAGATSWDSVLKSWSRASRRLGGSRYDSLKTALRMTWEAVSDTSMAHELWGVMAFIPDDLDVDELEGLTKCFQCGRDDFENAYQRLWEASIIDCRDGALTMLVPVREAYFELASEVDVFECQEVIASYLVEQSDYVFDNLHTGGAERNIRRSNLQEAIQLLALLNLAMRHSSRLSFFLQKSCQLVLNSPTYRSIAQKIGKVGFFEEQVTEFDERESELNLQKRELVEIARRVALVSSHKP